MLGPPPDAPPARVTHAPLSRAQLRCARHRKRRRFSPSSMRGFRPAGCKRGPIFERRGLIRIEQGAARVVALRAQPHLSKVGRDHRGGEHDPPGPVDHHHHAPSVHPFIAQSAVKYPCAAAAAGYYHRAPRAARSSHSAARARQVCRKTRRNAAIFIG